MKDAYRRGGFDGTEGGTDNNDTLEYQTRHAGPYRGHGGSRPGRGYWIGPGEEGYPGDGSPAVREQQTDRAWEAGRAHPSHHGRRVLLWMVLSLAVLVALVVVTALTVTGEIVVPALTAKLFPIQYQEDIARVAAKYGQDPYLVAAMVKTESGYDATAESPAGAVGLMQLMPSTAEWVASKIGDWEGGPGPDLTDPAANLELGVWYLDHLGERYGEGSMLALAAYNAGLGNVDEWVAEAGGPDSFDVVDIPFPETRQYVERVEHYRQLYVRVHPDVF